MVESKGRSESELAWDRVKGCRLAMYNDGTFCSPSSTMPPKLVPKPKKSSNPRGPKSTIHHVRKLAKKKEPLPVPERIKRHFTSLCAQIDGGHISNALKTCDKSLFISLIFVGIYYEFSLPGAFQFCVWTRRTRMLCKRNFHS